jgi:pimeloyl-ACP methyl ester carboxylesterase
MSGEIVTLEVRPSDIGVPVQGIQDKLRIYGRLSEQGCSRKVACVLMHPTVNYMNHYLIEPLRSRGCAVLALNSRYIGNDSMLLMERVIQDLGVGVRFLRERGYQRVIYIGNSGGGALGCFYQSQAERLTIRDTVDGRPLDLTSADLPAVDAIALSGVHLGRSETFGNHLDPSVIDERDFLSADPDLDMYERRNGPPYSPAWLERYYAAQRARHEKITGWVLGRLREIAALPTERRVADQAFIVYRTCARPQMMDASLDPNDRPPGVSIWGDARASNYAPTVLGRFATLRSYLSQWSLLSRAKGPACLAQTSVPVLNVEFSADEGTYPADVRAFSDAARGRCQDYVLRGARHYPFLQPNGERLVGELADVICQWAR